MRVHESNEGTMTACAERRGQLDLRRILTLQTFSDLHKNGVTLSAAGADRRESFAASPAP